VHGLQQLERAQHIVVVILERLGHRFAHRLESGKVDHRMRLAALQRRLQRRLIANVAFDEPNFFSGDAFNSCQRFRLAVAEIVEYGHLMTCLQQLDAGMGANVASTAGDKYHDGEIECV